MGGKIVQLVQGRKKELEFDNFDEWIERFSGFPLVQLIDLDAAIGSGDNRALIADFVRRLPCQVGGGIRTVETAREILALGARRVILGSSLIQAAQVNTKFAQEIAGSFGRGQTGICRRCQRRQGRHSRLARGNGADSGGDDSRAGCVVLWFSLYAY